MAIDYSKQRYILFITMIFLISVEQNIDYLPWNKSKENVARVIMGADAAQLCVQWGDWCSEVAVHGLESNWMNIYTPFEFTD